MSNELYLHILVAGVITLIYAGLLELWKDSKVHYDSTIAHGASLAFDNAIALIRENPRAGDDIIEEFESHWSAYLTRKELRYYTDRLYKINFS
jgi:hypothetical protein